MNSPMPRGGVTPEINQACDRFETRFRSGDRPMIEEFLCDTAEPHVTTLLRELIALECELRRDLGELPDIGDYLPRFRPWEPVVKMVLDDELERQKRHRIGRYQLLLKLGQGGFGTVWRAMDRVLKRPVAVKILHSFRAFDESSRRQFYAEARATARLSDQRIVRVLDYETTEDCDYIVYDLIEGGSLHDRLKQSSLEPRQAAEWCKDLAHAVHYAHTQKVLHRDLKPANVLVDETGRVFVTDFGLAKIVSGQGEAGAASTRTGDLKGTYPYMSPEQLVGDCSERSDVYGLGATLYHLLTGCPPFQGSVAEVIRNVESAMPAPPSSGNPKVPADLDVICLKALAKVPEDRYQSAEDFANDLEAYLSQRPIKASSVVKIAAKRSSKAKLRLLLGGLAMLGGVLTVVILTVLAKYWQRDGAIPLQAVKHHQWPEPIPGLVRVRIDTEPPEAVLAYIPLDETHHLPRLEATTFAASKKTVRLAPGPYLVEAVDSNGGFHQVWRCVPDERTTADRRFPHLRWDVAADGAIELPAISIPKAAELEAKLDLVLVESADFFADSKVQIPGKSWAMHELLPFGGRFWLGRTEISGDRYRMTTGEILPKHDGRLREPADYLNWNQAVWCAELLGGRLPSDGEYWTAMMSEKLVRDWSDRLNVTEKLENWRLLPVDEELPDEEVSETPRRFVHLATNAAEWTLSRPKLKNYPDQKTAPDDLSGQRLRRIVSGGAGESFGQSIQPMPFFSMEYQRFAFATDQTPGLAFRLARSVRPLVLPLSSAPRRTDR